MGIFFSEPVDQPDEQEKHESRLCYCTHSRDIRVYQRSQLGELLKGEDDRVQCEHSSMLKEVTPRRSTHGVRQRSPAQLFGLSLRVLFLHHYVPTEAENCSDQKHKGHNEGWRRPSLVCRVARLLNHRRVRYPNQFCGQVKYDQ